MRVKSLHQRKAEISAINGVKKFPRPSLGLSYLIEIANFINIAFVEVFNDKTCLHLNSYEDDISDYLATKLEKYIENNTYQIKDFIIDVSREPKKKIFSAESFCRPDFVLKLNRSINGLGTIVEAKNIFKNKTSVNLYCNDGISRFLDGQYAWDSTEGFMIAYVRDDAKVVSDLNEQLEELDSFSVISMPVSIDGFNGDLAKSKHNRTFKYIIPPFRCPGPITLLHLWLPYETLIS